MAYTATPLTESCQSTYDWTSSSSIDAIVGDGQASVYQGNDSTATTERDDADRYGGHIEGSGLPIYELKLATKESGDAVTYTEGEHTHETPTYFFNFVDAKAKLTKGHEAETSHAHSRSNQTTSIVATKKNDDWVTSDGTSARVGDPNEC